MFQVESSVALKPFLMKLTRSELHALMTSGFATVAGTVIAAYIEFGVSRFNSDSIYSRPSLSRLRLSRITAYLEEKI